MCIPLFSPVLKKSDVVSSENCSVSGCCWCSIEFMYLILVLVSVVVVGCVCVVVMLLILCVCVYVIGVSNLSSKLLKSVISMLVLFCGMWLLQVYYLPAQLNHG